MGGGQVPIGNFKTGIDPGVGLRTETATRLRWLARIVILWAGILFLKLFVLQIIQHDSYAHQAQAQQEKLVKIQPPRGAIVDRDGRRLAMSLPVDSVFVNPLLLKDVGMASAVLSKFLNLDARELTERIQTAIVQHKGFLWVKRKITQEESERLRNLKFEWIGITPESRRYYPYDSLAAHIIGGVDTDEQGTDGIEYTLNDDLAGAAGYLRLSTDVQQHSFASEYSGTPPQPGRDIKLTIDSRIQYIAEQAIQKAVTEFNCTDGSIIVIDPHTGDILAMANYPTYNPNEKPKPRNPGEQNPRLDLAISVPFEPGSVFKVMTLSTALETTNLRPDSIINCGGGVMNLYGRVIHDDRTDHYASLSMADVLAHSSNIGAINIALKAGKENFYTYIKKFGFGTRIGLPLPGESPGVVHSLKRWQATSIGSVAMGHEVSVTTLQLAQACTTIANGGFKLKPRLLAESPASVPERIIRPETAIMMRQMMEGVNLHGTGRLYAQIPGYTSGGKTGTAQIVDPESGRYTNLNNASYMGFAPLVNPKIVVVVAAHGSHGRSMAAQVAAPAFSTVAGAALRILDVPQDLPETLLVSNSPKKVAAADTDDMAIAGISSSVPLPLVPDDDNNGDQRIFLNSSNPPAPVRNVAGPKVPDFSNKTMREVIEESSRLGIQVDFTGSGLVRAQAPAAGSILSSGEHVQVRFGR